MEYRTEINGIEVVANYSEACIEGTLKPLIVRLQALRKQKGRRILVMLSAPPAAGKSTLCSFLKTLSPNITVLGMDGFHRRQEDLLANTTVRDGKTVSLVEIKGAPETFDLPKLTAYIQRAAAGEVFGWPVYNRLLHNPVDDVLKVDGEILLLEGNYLLLDEPGWRDLHACADFTISVHAEEDQLRDRLIWRKMASGTSREEAVHFVEFSDLTNARLCLAKSLPASLVLRLEEDGSYLAE